MFLEPPPNIEAVSACSDGRRLAGDVRRWFALGLLALLAAGAGLLCWRRTAGRLENPLDWPFMAAAAGLVIVLASAIRILCRHACWSHFSIAVNRSVIGFTTATVVLIGYALSLPGSSWLGLALLWGLVAGEEYWTWKAVVRGSPPSQGHAGLQPRAARQRTSEVPENTGVSPTLATWAAPATTDGESCELPADVLQQIIRNRVPDGTETVSGWLRASLAAGQRTASVHVAFCPPFPRAPSFDVEQQEGEPVRIKVVQLQSYGARLDLKLLQPSLSAVELVLRFTAGTATALGEPAKADRAGSKGFDSQMGNW